MTLPSIRHSLRMVIVLGALPGCALFGRLNSTTMIEPGQAFLLGGDQRSSFTVRGTNAGRVPVVVYEEREGRRDSLGTVAPGGEIDAQFRSRTMAVFANPSKSTTAIVSVKVSGDIAALGMRYQPVPAR